LFLKIEVHGVQTSEDSCSSEITITVSVTNKNYNCSNNKEIFNVSDYISVYAVLVVDKQSSAD